MEGTFDLNMEMTKKHANDAFFIYNAIKRQAMRGEVFTVGQQDKARMIHEMCNTVNSWRANSPQWIRHACDVCTLHEMNAIGEMGRLACLS